MAKDKPTEEMFNAGRIICEVDDGIAYAFYISPERRDTRIFIGALNVGLLKDYNPKIIGLFRESITELMLQIFRDMGIESNVKFVDEGDGEIRH